MKYNIDSVDDEFYNLLPPNIDNLKSRLEINVQDQEKMLSTILISINHAKFNNIIPTEKIWNLAGFVMIVSMDLKTTIHGILTSNNEWMKRLYLRQACLITYEAILDIFELLGKNYKKMITEHFGETALDQEYNALRKSLNAFKKLHQARIKKIRNVSIAHKDHAIEKQIQQITDLSLNDNLMMLLSFDEILNDLGKTIQKTINQDLKRLSKTH